MDPGLRRRVVAWLLDEQGRNPARGAIGEAISYALGQGLAGLYSLIATCEVNGVNGVNPVAYLADVLLRVQTHPASRIDELLPHLWKPPAEAQPSA